MLTVARHSSQLLRRRRSDIPVDFVCFMIDLSLLLRDGSAGLCRPTRHLRNLGPHNKHRGLLDAGVDRSCELFQASSPSRGQCCRGRYATLAPSVFSRFVSLVCSSWCALRLKRTQRDQTRSLGDKQLDHGIGDTLVSVDGITCRREVVVHAPIPSYHQYHRPIDSPEHLGCNRFIAADSV